MTEGKNEGKILKVKVEIADTKAKSKLKINQIHQMIERIDRQLILIKCNLGWRSRSKEVEAVKAMSIKEDYMSKPQVIPGTVNKMGRISITLHPTTKGVLLQKYKGFDEKKVWQSSKNSYGL